MEREAYQPPTASGTRVGAGGGDSMDRRSNMAYICGDCGSRVELRKDAHIMCDKCAGRVLYKERTKRMVQFEAR